MKADNQVPRPPRRTKRGNWKLPARCSQCGIEGRLEQLDLDAAQLVRGAEINCAVPKWVCKNCNAAFQSPDQATTGVKLAIREYQKQHNLLTADEIIAGRKKLGLNAAAFGLRANLGEATIKRLEAGTTVQQPGTDALIRDLLENCPQPGYMIETGAFLLVNSNYLGKDLDLLWSLETAWNAVNSWRDGSSEDLSKLLSAADSNELALAA